MRNILAILLCVVLVLGLTSALATDYTFTVHHIAVTNHPYHWGAEYFNEKLVEYSDGHMMLDIYRPSAGTLPRETSFRRSTADSDQTIRVPA